MVVAATGLVAAVTDIWVQEFVSISSRCSNEFGRWNDSESSFPLVLTQFSSCLFNVTHRGPSSSNLPRLALD